MVEAIFDVMADALKAGRRIELRGFGVFAVRTRPARVGRNPKTGARVDVPERRTLSFTVGKQLRERIQALALRDSALAAPPPPLESGLPPPRVSVLEPQARI